MSWKPSDRLRRRVGHSALMLALLLSVGCSDSETAGSDSPTEPPAVPSTLSFEAVEGTWVGTVEDQFVGDYEMEIVLEKSALLNQRIGSFAYAIEGGCGGDLLATSADATQFGVREQLTYGQDLCAAGSLGLTYDLSSDQLEFQHFNLIGEPRNTGLLKRN